MNEQVVMESRSFPAWELFHSGESLVIVKVCEHDPGCANRIARAFAAQIASANLTFVRDIVPAMTAVAVHYVPSLVSTEETGKLPHWVVAKLLSELLQNVTIGKQAQPRVFDIPVCYGGEHGPDLDQVAATCGLSAADVISLHGESVVDVMMIGFAPGHPYIGMLDERLAVPRRVTPRPAVPQGSIGLANRQSVIYPVMLPSGWNLIGRTPLQMFDPERTEPCLLRAGDQVRFVPISREEFDARAEDQGGAR
jgi:KipI family sensor histidine kinase inhibitor